MTIRNYKALVFLVLLIALALTSCGMEDLEGGWLLEVENTTSTDVDIYFEIGNTGNIERLGFVAAGETRKFLESLKFKTFYNFQAIDVNDVNNIVDEWFLTNEDQTGIKWTVN